MSLTEAKSSKSLIDFISPSNVLTSYYLSPTFLLQIKPLPSIEGSVTTTYGQERVYDIGDTLDEWLGRNTIPFLRLDTLSTFLFFGGPRHMMSLCRIAAQRVFEKYGAIGPLEGDYHRIVEVKAMPASHGIPSEIFEGFEEMGYRNVEKNHLLVKKAFSFLERNGEACDVKELDANSILNDRVVP